MHLGYRAISQWPALAWLARLRAARITCRFCMGRALRRANSGFVRPSGTAILRKAISIARIGSSAQARGCAIPPSSLSRRARPLIGFSGCGSATNCSSPIRWRACSTMWTRTLTRSLHAISDSSEPSCAESTNTTANCPPRPARLGWLIFGTFALMERRLSNRTSRTARMDLNASTIIAITWLSRSTGWERISP